MCCTLHNNVLIYHPSVCTFAEGKMVNSVRNVVNKQFSLDAKGITKASMWENIHHK